MYGFVSKFVCITLIRKSIKCKNSELWNYRCWSDLIDNDVLIIVILIRRTLFCIIHRVYQRFSVLRSSSNRDIKTGVQRESSQLDNRVRRKEISELIPTS